MWPGLNKTFGLNYNEYPPEYVKLFDVSGSSKAYEEDQGLTGFGLAAEKGEGDSIKYDDASQSFTMRYQNKTYTLGFAITQETIEDNQYDLSIVGKNQSAGLGRSMRLTKEFIGANLFNRAFDSTLTYGDGYQMIGTAQPTKAGGTFRNTLATQADLSELSLEQALIDIAGFRRRSITLSFRSPTIAATSSLSRVARCTSRKNWNSRLRGFSTPHFRAEQRTTTRTRSTPSASSRVAFT